MKKTRIILSSVKVKNGYQVCIIICNPTQNDIHNSLKEAFKRRRRERHEGSQCLSHSECCEIGNEIRKREDSCLATTSESRSIGCTNELRNEIDAKETFRNQVYAKEESDSDQ